MQLDVAVVKKKKKKPLDIRCLFNLEQLSCAEMSQYGRSIAAIWKPKLYYLTGAYVGFHALEAPTYGTQDKPIYIFLFVLHVSKKKKKSKIFQ